MKSFHSLRYLFSTAVHKVTKKKSTGNIYTWGRNTNSLGYAVSTQTTQVVAPKKLEQFKNNITKTFLGIYHSAVLTD